MNYLAFEFTIIATEQSEQLVALLSEQLFEGFEESDNCLKAFIPETIFNLNAFNDIVGLFPFLTYTRSTIENINWNQQWEQSFEPVIVGDFVAIRAHFHQPITNVQHEIIITPKMSFGTGHHGTTYIMMQHMQQLDFAGKTVLDFGTGTGVLAILAEKLGAEKVLGIDIDEWSIINAQENIAQNHCTKIIIEEQDAIPLGQTYDIILANINLNVITANLSAIVSVANKGCTIIFSGFLKENEAVMQAQLLAAGLTFISILQKGEWIAITVRKDKLL